MRCGMAAMKIADSGMRFEAYKVILHPKRFSTDNCNSGF
jgi:hypothetical protein